MHTPKRTGLAGGAGEYVSLFLLGLGLSWGAGTAHALEAEPQSTNGLTAPEPFPALCLLTNELLILQEFQTVLQSVERLRGEIEQMLERQNVAFAGQLARLDRSLTRQRDEDFNALQTAEQGTLWAVIGMGGVCLVGLLMMALVQWRGTSLVVARLGPAPGGLALASGLTAALQDRETVEETGRQLERAIDRVETRLGELERVLRPPTASRPMAEPLKAREPTAAHAAQAEKKSAPHPHLMLTVGDGEALIFRPPAIAGPRARLGQALTRRFKKLFGLAGHPKPAKAMGMGC